MLRLRNKTVRNYNLPARTGPDGETFGKHQTLFAQSTLDVPAWYLEELLKLPGWRRRLRPSDRDRVIDVINPSGGAPAIFEQRIIELRKARRAELEAKLEERHRAERERVKREAELAVAKANTRTGDLETKLAAKDAKIAELEAKLAGGSKADPPADTEPAKPKGSSSKGGAKK